MNQWAWLRPEFLWGLAAVILPLVIHLLGSRRRKIVPIATLRFLEKARARASARRSARNIHHHRRGQIQNVLNPAGELDRRLAVDGIGDPLNRGRVGEGVPRGVIEVGGPIHPDMDLIVRRADHGHGPKCVATAAASWPFTKPSPFTSSAHPSQGPKFSWT